jgi:NTE family protein
MHGWPAHPPGSPAPEGEAENGEPGRNRFTRWVERQLDQRLRDDDEAISLTEIMARSLDTMQAQISRVQLALDPPELVIRIPRDACLFYEFWRAREVIAIGRAEADKALDAAGY